MSGFLFGKYQSVTTLTASTAGGLVSHHIVGIVYTIVRIGVRVSVRVSVRIRIYRYVALFHLCHGQENFVAVYVGKRYHSLALATRICFVCQLYRWRTAAVGH